MITEQIAETSLNNRAPEQTRTCGNPQIQPSNNPVPGHILLDELESLLTRFVILPDFAAETLALWILHTYAFELRDVSTYLGVESPEKRCGKTTLLSILSRLANRPVAAANISPSAFFRVIEEMRPTLLIDEADTFLRGNDEIRGILNAGYTRDTAYVVRATQADANGLLSRQANGVGDVGLANVPLPLTPTLSPGEREAKAGNQSVLKNFSCWCPKVMAAIGRLPDTLADRCIVIRMERKTIHEDCERLRNFESSNLRERCAEFVRQNRAAVASAEPEIPESLHDRAADIWEPLFALADLAGGDWPRKAREAAEGLATGAQSRSPIGAFLIDIYYAMAVTKTDRISSRELYIVPVLMALGVQQLWADITIDLGSSRIVTNEIDRIAFSDLNGTPVTGTLSVDFVFSNDAFVRLFNQYFVPGGSVQGIGTSSSLDISLSLQTSGSGLVGFLRGTGYIFDRAGNPIPGYGVTGSASSDQGAMFIGLFPLARDQNGAPNTDLLRPLDFYGVHFNLILPEVPSLKVTGADFAIFDPFHEFGIGPNIPLDIPEPSAFAFAGLVALAYLLSRRRS